MTLSDFLDEVTGSQLFAMMVFDEEKYRAAFDNATAEGGLTLEELLTVASDDMEQLVSMEIKSIVENEGIELDANGDGKIDFEGKRVSMTAQKMQQITFEYMLPLNHSALQFSEYLTYRMKSDKESQ